MFYILLYSYINTLFFTPALILFFYRVTTITMAMIMKFLFYFLSVASWLEVAEVGGLRDI